MDAITEAMGRRKRMKCPKCNSSTYATGGRWDAFYKNYMRYRTCKECGYRFVTGERYIRDMYPNKGRPRKGERG